MLRLIRPIDALAVPIKHHQHAPAFGEKAMWLMIGAGAIGSPRPPFDDEPAAIETIRCDNRSARHAPSRRPSPVGQSATHEVVAPPAAQRRGQLRT